MSQLPEKSLIYSVFNDHFKHKTVNKITCRMPSSNPGRLCTLFRLISNCYDYFLRYSGFLDLFGKVFLRNSKFALT